MTDPTPDSTDDTFAAMLAVNGYPVIEMQVVVRAAESIAAELSECPTETAALDLAWFVGSEVEAIGSTVLRTIVSTAASIYALEVMTTQQPEGGTQAALTRLAVFCGELDRALGPVTAGTQ